MQKMNAKELVDHMNKDVRTMGFTPTGAVALETNPDPCREGYLITGDLWCIDSAGVRRRFTKTVIMKEEAHV